MMIATAERVAMQTAKRILLAEDDEAHAELIVHAIQRGSPQIEVDVVRDGEQAIDYLFGLNRYAEPNRPPLPDLILLDLNMPRMDGRQVLQILRRVRSGQKTTLPPIVVLTSSDADTDIQEVYAFGAQSYLVKPIDFDRLTGTVHQAVQYWLELNQPSNREHLYSHQLYFPH